MPGLKEYLCVELSYEFLSYRFLFIELFRVVSPLIITLNPLLFTFNKFIMNIFIAGLSYGINDADLNELFAEYGEISSA